MVTSTEWALCFPRQVLCGYARGNLAHTCLSFAACLVRAEETSEQGSVCVCDELLALLI